MKTINIENCAKCPYIVNYDDMDQCGEFDFYINFPSDGIHNNCELEDLIEEKSKFGKWVREFYPNIINEWSLTK